MSYRIIIAYILLSTAIVLAVIMGLKITKASVSTELLRPLPTVPDLSRWPREFQDRVATTTRAAIVGENRILNLGELSQLYFSNGYIGEATDVLKALLEQEPTNGRWPYLLGIIEERAERRESALSHYTKAAQLMPSFAPALIHQANLLAISGKSEEARRIFEHCLTLNIMDPRVHFGLAKLDFARGNEPAAVEKLRKAVKQFPEYQETHLMLSDLLEKSGQLQEANEQRAFLNDGQASPPDIEPFIDDAYKFCYDSYRLQAVGEIRNQVQDYEGALFYLQRAGKLEPANTDIQDGIARAYIGLRRWNDAESALRGAIDQSKSKVLLTIRLSEVLFAQGRSDEAMTSLVKLVALEPSSATTQNAVGLAYLRTEQLPKAIAAFVTASQFDPSLAEAKFNLANVLLRTNDAKGARLSTEQGLKLRPKSIQGLVILTAASTQLGDMETAVAGARELIARTGNAADYRNVCSAAFLKAGNLAAERGEHSEAEQLYRDGLKANDLNGQLHGALGMLYGKIRQFEKAQEEFKIFLQLEPHNALSYILLGAALNAATRTAEAHETWKAGLEIAIRNKNNVQRDQLQKLLGSP